MTNETKNVGNTTADDVCTDFHAKLIRRRSAGLMYVGLINCV